MSGISISIDSLLPPSEPNRAHVLHCGQDGRLQACGNLWMTLRSGLHRLFRIGKTSSDIARNQASWRALIAAMESRGGSAVRQRVCHASLRLAGDDMLGLSIEHRLERGTYLSHDVLQHIDALFRDACRVQRNNERTYMRLMAPGKDGVSASPLHAMLEGISLRLDETVPDDRSCPFPDTRAYVAEQLKLGLQAQAAQRPRRDPVALQSALASCAPELAGLDTPGGRAQWLRQFDVRLLAGPCQRDAMSAEQRKTSDRHAAVAALLSEWRQAELLRALKQNASAIADERAWLQRREAAAGTLRDETSGEAGVDCAARPAVRGAAAQRCDDTLATLLLARTNLLAELKQRELHDVLRRCDGELALTSDETHVRALMQRRAGATALLASDLAVLKQRDFIRQDLVKGLCRTVQAEVDRRTMLGECLDETALIRLVAGLLSTPSYLREFLPARNLQYLHDLGHGTERAAAIADLVRACDRHLQDPQERGELDSSDFQWLAAALEAGEDEAVVLNTTPMLKGARRLFARFTRERWPIAAICDAVASLLDDFAEDRTLAQRQWRHSEAALETRWQAGVHALCDRMRTAELGPADLARVILPAIRPFVRDRHVVMEQVRRETLLAEARLSELRALYPELEGWSAPLPAGALAATLLDLASLQITSRLINAHNLRLEAERAAHQVREEARLSTDAARRLQGSLHTVSSARQVQRERMADQGLDDPETDGEAMERDPIEHAFQQQWIQVERDSTVTIGTTANALENALDASIERARERSVQQMVGAKRDFERRMRDILEGGPGGPGMLETVCAVLEQVGNEWRRWSATMNRNGELVPDPATRRQILALREAASKAAHTVEEIRMRFVYPMGTADDLPPAVAAQIVEERKAAHDALDALRQSVQWVHGAIRIADTPGPRQTAVARHVNVVAWQERLSRPIARRLAPIAGWLRKEIST